MNPVRNNSLLNKIRQVFIMSRPPFHIVGILPFILGTVLAYKITGIFILPVFLLALFAVILIMLLTYYNGEYYDIKEDKLAAKYGKSSFSGGSQIIAQNMLPRKYAKIASYIALGIAIIIGLLLQFYYKTGIWTIPLGALGIFLGFFYSNPPFRWVSRGIGEILIGFSYGWLPVATAFYIQAQSFNAIANWISIPVALSIFNVIFINEYPDLSADIETGKRHIVARMGMEKGRFVYAVSIVLMMIFFGLSIYRGVPLTALYFAILFFLISAFVSVMLIKKSYTDSKKLEMLCGLTIVVNIGINISYIAGIAAGL